MSAEYAALLRPFVGQVVEEPQQYRKALDFIRYLAQSDRIRPEDAIREIREIFAALARLQRDLDDAESVPE